MLNSFLRPCSPYWSYCAEVWANNYKSNVQSLFILQKRAICNIHNAEYRDHSNPLFLLSHLLKFADLVEFQIAQTMYKAKNNQLPANIQQMFSVREEGYNLRGHTYFKSVSVPTMRRNFSICVCGVRLWISLNVELRECPNITFFIKRYKEMIFSRYRN